MNFEQAKKKALDRVREKGLDKLLIAAFLETNHYPSWSKNSPAGEWNIGLANISGVEVSRKVGYFEEKGEAVVAELDGIRFQLSGSKHFTDDDGSGICGTQTASLHIGEACVLSGLFFFYDIDACIPEDFSLYSVEEYHENAAMEQLLRRISELIKLKRIQQKELQQKKQAEHYSGKFSFNDDE